MLAHFLKCLMMLMSTMLVIAPAFGASWKSSLKIDASDPSKAAPWGRFESYEYPAKDVAPWTGPRKVLFGTPLELNFEGLEEGQDCMIRVSFLSDAPREMAIDVNGTEIESSLKVDRGVVRQGEWVIPSSRLYSGTIALTINPIVGSNAVIQTLEIFTRDGRRLRPGKRKEFRPPTQDELEALVVPMQKMAPRPSLVTGTQSPVISLNGEWLFSASGKGNDLKPIQVPGEWKMQGFNVAPKAFAKYVRTIDVPADWAGRQIILRFDAVHAVCRIFVNGTEIGGHEGGMIPFSINTTKAIRPGARNSIEVLVQSESVADSVGCISQYAAHQVGGILRKVAMMALPNLYVASDNNYTVLKGQDAVLHYDVELANVCATSRKATMNLELKDASGQVVASQEIVVSAEGSGLTPAHSALTVKNAKLWTSETPNLYTLSCTLSEAGQILSQHVRKVGLRTVQVKGNQLFVNEKPVKLFAVCRHEVHPLRGRSLTPELCRKDAELYKNAGVNTIRTSHYPPSEEFLDICDELGLFVESEAAVCWIQHGASPVWKRWNYQSPDYFLYLLRPSLDQIAAYRNHPSIIMWSWGNESRWSCLWEKVAEVTRRYEKTRPFVFHDQCWGGFNNAGSKGDIANYHYPSENNSDEWSKVGKPVWFGEYAHLQCYNRRELATDPGIREDWGRPLQRMVDLMWEQPGCLGGSIWSGIDDVFHLPSGDLCGYGHWGPIDAWRRPKPEYHGLRMAYTPFRVFSVDARDGKTLKLSVQNRQNFLNLKENSIEWSCGDKKGKIEADLPPHAKGELVVNAAYKPGDSVAISVKDPSGREIAREVIEIPGGKLLAENVPGKICPVQMGDQALRAGAMELPLPVPMVLDLNGSGGAAGPAGSTLANVIEPYTPVEPWSWKKNAAGADGVATWTGEGALGKGTLVAETQQDGSVLIHYAVTVNRDVNPRQWGLVWTLPRSFDTMDWFRNSHWSWYPNDQIGRPRGTVKAQPVFRKWVEEPRKVPTGAWKDDANALGCNDFTATKMRIRRLSMLDAKGCAITFRPVPKGQPQAVRAWVVSQNPQDGIRVLIAGFNTGGSDGFFATHYSTERRPIKKGETIHSDFLISVSNVQ